MNNLELKPLDQVEITLRCKVDEVTHDARGGYFVRLEVHGQEESPMNLLRYIDIDMNTLTGSIRKLEYDPFLGKMK